MTEPSPLPEQRRPPEPAQSLSSAEPRRSAAVRAVRLAVRGSLASLEAPGLVVVACSGGADSLSLLAATVAEAPQAHRRVLGATVDHGMQEGSARRADEVVATMAGLGADETLTARVRVEADGHGPEAAAREARYAVLEQVAQTTGAAAVLLGHTLDDQAETVLLGLARGSGGRSIAGMRPRFGPFRRPLLDVRRSQTEGACAAWGITVWQDPHNHDPRFTRSRVRHRVLPVLEAELGPGVAEALARTAAQLRPDTEALDTLAGDALGAVSVQEGAAVEVEALLGLREALRTRVLRLAALRAGAPPSELFHVHVVALHRLVLGEIRGTVQLPGHLSARRAQGLLGFAPTAAAE